MNLEEITFYDCVAFIKGLCFAFFFLRFISLQSGYAGKEEVVCQGPLWKQL